MKNMKLGKLAKKVDARTLQLSKYLTTSLPPLPKTVENDALLTEWTMMGNDVAGDCTCAAGGHGVMAWTFPNNDLVTPSLASVLAAYTAVTAQENGGQGYDPATGANDNGCTCLDVLNYWRQIGIGGHKISSFVEVNAHNQTEIKASIYLFGLVYIGIALPLSAQTQSTRWHVTDPSLGGDAAPGSWGGHCVIVVGYNADGVDVITWGQRVRMTWGFWRAYVDEAYGALSLDFFTASKAPNGFALATLQDDLSQIKK